MEYKLRQFTTEDKFSQALTLDALAHAIRLEDIKAVLQAEGAQARRERKRNMVVVVLVALAMNIYTHLSLRHVMQKIAQGLRFVWPDPTSPLPKASALTYRRSQLGVCPLASPQTPGAFLFGRCLMAIDNTLVDLPDTPDNMAVFGRYLSARGPSAFAQARAVYLAECGTHAIVDAGFWPGHTSERMGGFRVLRSVTSEMLVMWVRGFHDYDMFTGMALLWPTSTPVRRSGVSGENISGSVWLTTPSRSPPCRDMASLTTSSPRCWSPLWRPLWNSSVPITNAGESNSLLTKRTRFSARPGAPCVVGNLLASCRNSLR